MLVTVENDILEMNVVEDHQWFSVAVRRGGHIQIISGTECHTEKGAEELLEALAPDLKSGKWILGTQDARPFLKRVEPFAPVKLNNQPISH